MKARIRKFSGAGDSTLMEYETSTVDMAEVNRAIEGFEKQAGGKAFDFNSGEPLGPGGATREQTDILIVNPICGG